MGEAAEERARKRMAAEASETERALAASQARVAELEAQIEFNERRNREALDHATAPCNGLGCGRCSSCVAAKDAALNAMREALEQLDAVLDDVQCQSPSAKLPAATPDDAWFGCRAEMPLSADEWCVVCRVRAALAKVKP